MSNIYFALHEGKERDKETPGKQWLPFLTLENVLAFWEPERAEGIFREKRELMPNIVAKEKIKLFGDIAYNYCPFIHAMPSVFPQSKLIVIYRDGRDFVRSAYIADQNDKAPVGWGDSVEKNDVNKFISLGRLRPQNSDDENSRWQSMSIVAKNAWLWAETNKIIFEGLKKMAQRAGFTNQV